MKLLSEINQSESLLAVLLGVKKEAIRSVVDRFPSIQDLMVAGRDELNMLTDRQYKRLQALLLFGERTYAPRSEITIIRKPEDVFELVHAELRFQLQERFVCLFLNAKNHVIGKETLGIGSSTACVIHPREVFRAALRYSAASVVAVHNHPSGDPTPSSEDVTITKRLAEAGEGIGIELLDHVIVGDGRWISLKEHGVL